MTRDQFLLPADFFVQPGGRSWTRVPMKYRRFPTLASAVVFAVEKAESPLSTVVIRTDFSELTGGGIKVAYDELIGLRDGANG